MTRYRVDAALFLMVTMKVFSSHLCCNWLSFSLHAYPSACFLVFFCRLSVLFVGFLSFVLAVVLPIQPVPTAQNHSTVQTAVKCFSENVIDMNIKTFLP